MSEVEQLALWLKTAFERRKTQEIVLLDFYARYEVITVDWEKVAETILIRERSAERGEK
jgi:hypothetical protein